MPAPPDAAPWTRTDRWIGIALVLVLLACLPFTTHPWFDVTNDARVYVLTARSIAQGDGYSLLGEPLTLRAPGLPAVLALAIHAGGDDFSTFNVVVSLFGVLAVVLLFVLLRERFPAWLAALLALVVWSGCGYQRLCNQVMSDVPGLALLLAALVLERYAARRRSLALDATTGLVLAAACYVRSVNVLAVAALVVARVSERQRSTSQEPWLGFVLRRLLPCPLVVLLLLLPWQQRNARVAPEPPVDQTGQYSLGTILLHEDAGDPRSPLVPTAEIVQRVPKRAVEVLRALGVRRLGKPEIPLDDPVDPGPAIQAGVLLAALLRSLWRRRGALELFALGSILVVLVFPSPFLPRYALPAWIAALPALVELVRDLAGRWLPSPLALALAATSALGLAAVDVDPHHRWSRIETTHTGLAEMAAAVERALEPDALLATDGGMNLAVFLDRPLYSLKFAIARSGVGPGTELVLDKYGLNTIVLTTADKGSKNVHKYVRETYGRPGLFVPADLAYVARVRP